MLRKKDIRLVGGDPRVSRHFRLVLSAKGCRKVSRVRFGM